MPEIQEVFRMATQKVRPDPGSLDRQHRGQRRRVATKRTTVYALVALLLIAGVVIGISTLRSDDVQPAGSGSNPTLAPSPRAEPTALPSGIVEPGTYVMSAVDPAFDAAYRITMTVPSAYEGYQGWALLGPNTGLSFNVVYNVFADPCHWSGTLFDPPVRQRVADLVAALEAQPGRHATTPTNVTLDGYAGKQIELTAPTDFADCDSGMFKSWTYSPGEADSRCREPGQHDLLWIVNVDGVPLVLDVAYIPGASAQERDGLLQIVEPLGSILCREGKE
jgi:hypothetical protein